MSAMHYTEAVLRAVADGVPVGRALSALDAVLTRNGHLKLKRKVLIAIADRLERTKRDGQAVLTIAREADERAAVRVAQELLDEIDGDSISSTVVDDTLIGGFVLATKTRRADRSHKRTLLNLYRRCIARTRETI